MYLKHVILKQQILYYKQITKFVFKDIHICLYKIITMVSNFYPKCL